MEIKDVEELALLARVELGEEEKAEILKDMKGILAYVETIEKVKLDDVKTDESLYNAWREDTEMPREFSSKLITNQFPDSQDGYLKVKKIL
ncbi:MAG: Asp-tRNA(Asn)/Glu-tRNA(Gln) amidotransferase subunit GatC [Candidatus Paceibacterota bacterium]